MRRVFRTREAYEQAKAHEHNYRASGEVRNIIETPVTSERYPVGGAGHVLQHWDTANDGRRKYAIFDPAGECHGMIWGFDEAQAKCRELIEAGTITR